jgi:hypothetical protein
MFTSHHHSPNVVSISSQLLSASSTSSIECFLLGYSDAPLTLLSSATLSLSDCLSCLSFAEEEEEGSIAVTSVSGLDDICCLAGRGGDIDGEDGIGTDTGPARNQGVWKSDEGGMSVCAALFFF